MDYAYYACSQISDLTIKKNVISLFFQKLCNENKLSLLATNYYFSQDDVDLVLESLYEKI